jgi:hypothetical protein|nr:MAG TPA: hypothetical protein [Caudoviricetes sp.]DAZ00440.1 MAG TPA: hypothetical protein [Caudoviricetes sp.]
MDIIHIDAASYDKLMNWQEENRELVKAIAPYNKYYFRRAEVVFTDSNIVGYFDFKRDLLRLRIKRNKKQIANCHIVPTPDDFDNDYGIYFDLMVNDESLPYDDACKVIQVVANTYIAYNALLIYGNLVDGSSITPRARTEGGDKHYFLKEYDNKIYAVSSHAHRSPEGIFSVRGHFRKYKSGKVIWIDEYLKGTDED